MTQQHYTNVHITKQKGAECEITATIPVESVAHFREKAIAELGKTVEVDGFRKGHVPADMLVKHLGEDRIMDKTAHLAIQKAYPQIVLSENLDAIGSPAIQITKLAADNPIEFTARTATMPKVTLPNYTKIAKDILNKKEEEVKVEDKEVADTLLHMRRQRANIESYEQQKSEGVEHPQQPEIDDADLPELTDEFVQTLGDFPTVADFEAKVRENILEEKKLRAQEKKRIEIVEKIIAEATIELPELLVTQEIARMQAQMEDQVASAGLKLEDYLTSVNQKLEDLHKEWRPEAEKRAKLQLILNTIAKDESIAPNEEEVTHEIEHVLEHYPHAAEENVRVYVETTKRNEMVFKFLETQGK